MAKQKQVATPTTTLAPFITETVAIADLKPHPQNYQQHPDDELDHIAASITEHGFYRPIVIARDNTMLAGHGVVKAAWRMGYLAVPVIRKDYDPFEPRALRILAGDNTISHLAERDDRQLTDLLREIRDTQDGLLGTGYTDEMLANLLMVTRPSSEINDLQAAAQWVGMPDYGEMPGQIQMTVHFASEEDRRTFLTVLGFNPDVWEKRKYLWYPDRERADPRNLFFASNGAEAGND